MTSYLYKCKHHMTQIALLAFILKHQDRLNLHPNTVSCVAFCFFLITPELFMMHIHWGASSSVLLVMKWLQSGPVLAPYGNGPYWKAPRVSFHKSSKKNKNKSPIWKVESYSSNYNPFSTVATILSNQTTLRCFHREEVWCGFVFADKIPF